ncbi:hypothetical protein L917_21664 [Phytophthora nicotianae]|uniref:Uncharacterized protein n=2 Tax=Phytophthora nicotianae TaxID=4792 RepID=W2PPK8_PHYN3|nr:hypothetical protein PPTG_23894 [Phytophthora nicotianae INRA-310]ETL77392.1 hypothetical protein L917_21664 [Phytophthora nicotianae]ETM37331.1 hypothetical protein L914_16104 [Phytophthora nicotianae]ETN02787.1 hypothetical protein PPTG_23894 [Phytophthora nicotianae INRA-310]
MKIYLEEVDKNESIGTWKCVHFDRSEYHNHPASENPTIHPEHRRRDREQLVSRDLTTKDLIASPSAVGNSPAVVVATFRQAHPETSITAKDIANHKDSDRRAALVHDTPTELLLKELTSRNIFSSTSYI